MPYTDGIGLLCSGRATLFPEHFPSFAVASSYIASEVRVAKFAYRWTFQLKGATHTSTSFGTAQAPQGIQCFTGKLREGTESWNCRRLGLSHLCLIHGCGTTGISTPTSMGSGCVHCHDTPCIPPMPALAPQMSFDIPAVRMLD